MDYGKFAYFKADEIEKRIGKMESKPVFFGCVEHSNPTFDHFFQSSLKFSMPTFQSINGSKVILIFKMTLNHVSALNATVKFLFNENVIQQKTQSFPIGETEIVVTKALTCFSNKSQLFEIEISGSESYSATVKSFEFVVYGNQVESIDSESSMSLSAACFENEASQKIACAYVENGKIYVSQFENENLTSLTKENFSFFKVGKLASVVYDKQGNLFVFRTNSTNELYFCRFFNPSNEIFIESEIESFSTGTSAIDDASDILICYLKNKKPKFRTVANSVVGEEGNFLFFEKDYVDINVANGYGSRNFVVVTEKNGANFCTFSLVEGNVPNNLHSLSLSFELSVNEI